MHKDCSDARIIAFRDYDDLSLPSDTTGLHRGVAHPGVRGVVLVEQCHRLGSRLQKHIAAGSHLFGVGQSALLR